MSHGRLDASVAGFPLQLPSIVPPTPIQNGKTESVAAGMRALFKVKWSFAPLHVSCIEKCDK